MLIIGVVFVLVVGLLLVFQDVRSISYLEGRYNFYLVCIVLVILIIAGGIIKLNKIEKKDDRLVVKGLYVGVDNFDPMKPVLRLINPKDSLINNSFTISLNKMYPRMRRFLKSGDHLEFYPDLDFSKDTVLKWKLKYRVNGTVLRFNNRCYNASLWLSDNDTIKIKEVVREDTIGSFYLIINRNKIIFTPKENLKGFTLFKYPLREGFPLYTILKRKAVNDTVFAKIFFKIRNLARHVLFVREDKGSPKSKLGIILIPFDGDTILRYKYKEEEKSWTHNSNEDSAEVAPGTVVKLGLGYRNSLGLVLGEKIFRESDNSRVTLKFTSPIMWELPPSDTFLIFSEQPHVPTDGFQLDLQNSLFNMVYKGIYSDGKLKIVGGDSLKILEFNRENFIGNKNLGFVTEFWRFNEKKLKLLSILPSVRVSLLVYLLIVIFAAIIFFTYKLGSRKEDIIILKVVFMLFLIITVWKFVISYRLAALPPSNVTWLELNNVFIKSFKIGALALIVIPLIFLIGFRLSGLLVRDRYRMGKGIYIGIYILFYVLGLILIISSQEESINLFIFKIRAYAFLLIWVISNYIVIPYEMIQRKFEPISEKLKTGLHLLAGVIYHSIALIVPAFIYLIFVKDFGIMIFFGIFIVVAIYKFIAERYNKLIGFFAIVFVLFISSNFVINEIVKKGKIVNPQTGKTIYFRFLVYKDFTNDYLLSFGQNLDARLFDAVYRNSVQAWQMKLYAAEGGFCGKGLGNVKLSNVGLTYPTSLSDASFSVLILSEWGLLGGMLLAFIYVILGLNLYRIILTYDKSYGVRTAGMLIFTIFSIAPLYMIGANLQLLPFTGQNIPLLSFHSYTDLWFTAFIIALVIALNKEESEDEDDEERESYSNLKVLGITLFISLFIFVPITVYNESNRRDFDFSTKVKKQIEKDIEELKFDKEKHKVVPKSKSMDLSRLKLSPLERLYINQLNMRENIFDPGGGLFYVVDDSVINVNEFYFKIPSPFKSGLRRVFIYDKGQANPLFVLSSGKGLMFYLKKGGFPDSIHIGRTRAQVSVLNQNVNVYYGNTYLFSLSREGDSVIINPKINRGWTIKVNNSFIDSNYTLHYLDIIKLWNKRTKRSIYLVYLGKTLIPLLYTAWRNDKLNRFLSPIGKDIPLLYSVASVFDNDRLNKSKVELQFTISTELQRGISKAIREYVRSRANWYWDKNPLTAKMVAVTIMDPFSGEVYAMSQWPTVTEDYNKIIKELYKIDPRVHWRLLSSFNLKNHAIGSTVKPLTLSAIAHAYDGKINISSLYFNDRADAFRVKDDKSGKVIRGHFHKNLCGLSLNPPWNCRPGRQYIPNREWINAKKFITRSLDFYEVMLSMIGFVPINNSYLNFISIRTNHPENADMKIGENYYKLNFNPDFIKQRFHNMRDSIDYRMFQEYFPFQIYNDNPYISGKRDLLDSLLLFKSYKELFDVEIVDRWPLGDLIDSISKTSYSAFIPHHNSLNLGDVNILYHVIPEPIIVNAKNFKIFRTDVIPFILGGGENRWNNVKMAESFARIITGVKVHAKLITEEARYAEMPPPINDRNWRYNNLIIPMENTWRQRGGTMYSLHDYISSRLPNGYKIIFKTGTIEEREGRDRESELLAFIFGKWNERERQFEPGRTIVGFFYMQDSKYASRRGMYKFRLFMKLFPYIKRFLQER